MQNKFINTLLVAAMMFITTSVLLFSIFLGLLRAAAHRTAVTALRLVKLIADRIRS